MMNRSDSNASIHMPELVRLGAFRLGQLNVVAGQQTLTEQSAIRTEERVFLVGTAHVIGFTVGHRVGVQAGNVRLVLARESSFWHLRRLLSRLLPDAAIRSPVLFRSHTDVGARIVARQRFLVELRVLAAHERPKFAFQTAAVKHTTIGFGVSVQAGQIRFVLAGERGLLCQRIDIDRLHFSRHNAATCLIC